MNSADELKRLLDECHEEMKAIMYKGDGQVTSDSEKSHLIELIDQSVDLRERIGRMKDIGARMNHLNTWYDPDRRENISPWWLQ